MEEAILIVERFFKSAALWHLPFQKYVPHSNLSAILCHRQQLFLCLEGKEKGFLPFCLGTIDTPFHWIRYSFPSRSCITIAASRIFEYVLCFCLAYPGSLRVPGKCTEIFLYARVCHFRGQRQKESTEKFSKPYLYYTVLIYTTS